MRPSRLALSAIAVAALLGLRPAAALTLTSPGGINAGNASQLRDPDVQADHLAAGGGPSMSATWADRTIAADPAPTADAFRAAPRLSGGWPTTGLIIGDRWHYPPIQP